LWLPVTYPLFIDMVLASLSRDGSWKNNYIAQLCQGLDKTISRSFWKMLGNFERECKNQIFLQFLIPLRVSKYHLISVNYQKILCLGDDPQFQGSPLSKRFKHIKPGSEATTYINNAFWMKPFNKNRNDLHRSTSIMDIRGVNIFVISHLQMDSIVYLKNWIKFILHYFFHKFW